jgi:hypothetical protein
MTLPPFTCVLCQNSGVVGWRRRCWAFADITLLRHFFYMYRHHWHLLLAFRTSHHARCTACFFAFFLLTHGMRAR